jgi:hypothetical protein
VPVCITARITIMTCRWLLRRDSEAPFFLRMSFTAPHSPFTPPDISDNGDMMGDFGLFAKRVFYEGAANAPFPDGAGLEIPKDISGISALQGLENPDLSRKLAHGDYKSASRHASNRRSAVCISVCW